MVEDAPGIEDALAAFYDFIGDDLIVGHNIHRFDISFVKNAAEKLGKTLFMNRYDVVKSNTNRSRIITILCYLLIWAVSMIVYWFFTSGSDAMGYSLLFMWIILPVTTFVVSVIIGRNEFWGQWKWAFTLFFGLMYMLSDYGTFKISNNLAFDKLNAPQWSMLVIGAVISAIGMLLGSLANIRAKRRKKSSLKTEGENQ